MFSKLRRSYYYCERDCSELSVHKCTTSCPLLKCSKICDIKLCGTSFVPIFSTPSWLSRQSRPSNYDFWCSPIYVLPVNMSHPVLYVTCKSLDYKSNVYSPQYFMILPNVLSQEHLKRSRSHLFALHFASSPKNLYLSTFSILLADTIMHLLLCACSRRHFSMKLV